MTADRPPFTRADWDALPQRARDYIAAIETNADPSGNVRDLFALRENVARLGAELELVRKERDEARADAERGFAKGAYARLKELQEAERELDALRTRLADSASADVVEQARRVSLRLGFEDEDLSVIDPSTPLSAVMLAGEWRKFRAALAACRGGV